MIFGFYDIYIDFINAVSRTLSKWCEWIEKLSENYGTNTRMEYYGEIDNISMYKSHKCKKT